MNLALLASYLSLAVGLAIRGPSKVDELNEALKANGADAQVEADKVLVHEGNSYIAIEEFVQGDRGEQEWVRLMDEKRLDPMLDDIFGHHNFVFVDDMAEWVSTYADTFFTFETHRNPAIDQSPDYAITQDL